MKFFFYMLILLIGVSLSSCDKNAHLREGEQNVSVGIVMTTPDLASDVYLWAFDAEGILRYEFRFETPEELASTTLPLPEGDYTLVVCNHLADAFLRETQIGVTKISEFHITQAEANASPEHAHYGITEVSVPSGLGGWQWVEATESLSRILAELQLTVSGLPQGVGSATAIIENCAIGFFPAENRLGEACTPVHLGDAVTNPATNSATFDRIRLMPTVAMPSERGAKRDKTSARTHVRLTLHYTRGEPDLVIQVEMPPLLNGGVYEVKIPYDDIRPGITLQITDINGWKDDTPIYGEILAPE